MPAKKTSAQRIAAASSSEAIVIYSGGQDSTTCLFWALKRFSKIRALTFDYGQRHAIELDCAKKLCARLKIEQKVISMNFLSELSENALTNKQIPIEMSSSSALQKEFEFLPSTFVPGRNALFLNLAVAYGISRGIKNYVIGVCEADYSGYPDCRETFVKQMETALSLAVDKKLQFHTPLMYLTKAETFHMAEELDCLRDVIENSHTCYAGKRDELHAWGYGCGTCPACKLRKKGFEEFLERKKHYGKSLGQSPSL